MTQQRPPTVAVTGTAEREVPPDSFVLAGNVRCRASTSAEVHERLAARVAELEAAIDRLGVAPADVHRGPVSGWQDGRGRNAAWWAARRVEVTGRVLDTAADVAGVLGAVQDVTVDGPYWHLDRDNPAHHELQTQAVHEAQARAQRYASAVGAALGRLVELSDVGERGGWMPQAAMARGGFASAEMSAGLESLDFSPQPVQVSASVQARWYLDLPE